MPRLSPPLAKVTPATANVCLLKILEKRNSRRGGFPSRSIRGGSTSSIPRTSLLTPIAKGRKPRRPIHEVGIMKLPKKPSRLTATRAAKPRYWPATMCPGRRATPICEKKKIKMNRSSILVAAKVTTPVMIADRIELNSLLAGKKNLSDQGFSLLYNMSLFRNSPCLWQPNLPLQTREPCYN